jgi:dihydrofolate reductase
MARSVPPEETTHGSCVIIIAMSARISIIAAIGKNRELGKQNKLVWRISADLGRVKSLTTGHPIIMGRKTYDSIGRPLPNRTNIVLSRTPTEIEGCIVVDSFEKALEVARGVETEEIFVFGGGQIYTEAMPLVDRLYLTRIDAEDPDSDAFFPDYSEFTTVISAEAHSEHEPPYTWLTLERA